MAVVTVQVGQCGNQLGDTLFQALYEHSTSEDTPAAAACHRSFFRDHGVARAVIIDTEPKVIEQIVSGARGEDQRAKSSIPTGGPRRHRTPGRDSIGVTKRHGSWAYNSATQICCHAQGGAANNWAYGYHAHGSTFAEDCVEGVRREAEQCDRLSGLCLLQSAAGGTGSGLGTYLTEVRTY